MSTLDTRSIGSVNNQTSETGKLVIEEKVSYGVPLNFRPENTLVYEETAPTVCNGTNPGHHQGVITTDTQYIVRRLTPTECARLQGMPDWWCDDVPHSDSAEYKMWGNGMALPCVLYIMEGIAEELKNNSEPS